MKKISGAKRYSHIDALRAIAVLLVVWLHVSEVYGSIATLDSQWVYRWADELNVGRVGVVIFFAISGFVISHSIKGKPIEGSRKFWIRRFFRLYPIFWVSIIAGIAVMSLGFGVHYDISTILANFTMLPQFLSHQMVLGLYWTLEVELVFYILIWLLFLLGFSREPLALFVMILLSILYFILSYIFQWHSDKHIGSSILGLNLAVMFWGALYRIWFDDNERVIYINHLSIPIKYLTIVATLLLLYIPIYLIYTGVVLDESKKLQFGLAYLLGISIFLLLNRFKIQNRLISYIGLISYSIYIFHPIVFNIIFANIDKPYSLPAHLPLWIYLLVNMALSILFASVLYRWIEKPTNDFGHRITSR